MLTVKLAFSNTNDPLMMIRGGFKRGSNTLLPWEFELTTQRVQSLVPFMISISCRLILASNLLEMFSVPVYSKLEVRARAEKESFSKIFFENVKAFQKASYRGVLRCLLKKLAAVRLFFENIGSVWCLRRDRRIKLIKLHHQKFDQIDQNINKISNLKIAQTFS